MAPVNKTEPVRVSYGSGSLPLELAPRAAQWHVFRPRFPPPLQDAAATFREACEGPIASRPLSQIVRAADRVVIVTSDGTRPVPNRLLVSWLLRELPVSPAQVTVLLGTGTHRPNTPAELRAMFGDELVRQVAIVNHDAFDPGGLTALGTDRQGHPVSLNRLYVEADKRIVLGFIEPHFFAGFSGGAKGVMPGVAGIDTIRRLHRAGLIADPRSTWGLLDDNPIQAEIADGVALCPPDFLVNVLLTGAKEIAGMVTGDYREAHRAGCARVRAESMSAAPRAFPVVIASNSGFPLDQNLYQTVKGISAAARIVERGGTIIMASECRDGIPEHGNFARIMGSAGTPAEILAWIDAQPETLLDQWQAQILAGILERAEVCLFSSLPEGAVRSCHLTPISDFQAAVMDRVAAAGRQPAAAVLPDGPLTIPTVAPPGGIA